MSALRRNATNTLLIGSGFFLVYWKTCVKLVGAWHTDDNYSHGYLIIPIALYLVWERRRRLGELEARPSMVGLMVVAFSLLLLAAGTLGSELFVSRLSMIGVLGGIVLYLFGWRTLKATAFPLAFLLLMIPLPAIIFNQIAFPLQLLASRVGEAALSAARVPVLREGNVLIMANSTLEVAEACSGIRSLVSLLTIGIVLGYFADPRPAVRVAVALCTVPVAIVANALRVAGTGIAAHYWGPAAAEGFLHTFSGWVVFVAALMMILAFQRGLARFSPAGSPAQPACIAP